MWHRMVRRKGYKKTFLSVFERNVVFVEGWLVGFEPTTFRTTI